MLMKAREGAALITEQENLILEYEKIVTKAKHKAAGQGALSTLAHWRESVAEVTLNECERFRAGRGWNGCQGGCQRWSWGVPYVDVKAGIGPRSLSTSAQEEG